MGDLQFFFFFVHSILVLVVVLRQQFKAWKLFVIGQYFSEENGITVILISERYIRLMNIFYNYEAEG